MVFFIQYIFLPQTSFKPLYTIRQSIFRPVICINRGCFVEVVSHVTRTMYIHIPIYDKLLAMKAFIYWYAAPDLEWNQPPDLSFLNRFTTYYLIISHTAQTISTDAGRQRLVLYPR